MLVEETPCRESKGRFHSGGKIFCFVLFVFAFCFLLPKARLQKPHGSSNTFPNSIQLLVVLTPI